MGKIKDIVGRVRGVGDPFKPTESEYRAALNALNIFFGVVIGVSLGGVEAMGRGDYMMLLLLTSTIVIAILYVSYLHRPLWNAIMLAAILGGFWYVVEGRQGGGFLDFEVPDKLMPTLWVWAGMAIVTEFSPRSPDPEQDQGSV